MKAVMYGGGNIGRGFIGALLSNSGYEVQFVDVVDDVINTLNKEHTYPIRIIKGDSFEDIDVKNVSAVDGKDPVAVAEAIAGAEIMATAVGVNVLKFIIPNIVAGLPNTLISAFRNIGTSKLGVLVPIITIVLLLAMIVFVVHVTNAERRLPVQYAKRQVGRRMYGGQNTYIPMKLNMSGVMPIIFASSIAAIPTTLALIFPPKGTGIWSSIVNFFSSTSPVYMVIYFLLIIGFSYFYLAISFNPVEVANNVKNNGGSIPGIRPGKPTVDYITRILSRITLIGAIFLGIVATLPLIVGMLDNSLAGLAFGGSSLLILVSVALETTKEIEAQMTMRHYKGFLE